MRSVLFKWHHSVLNLPLWFKHNEVIDITPEQIMELYNSGNDVMMRHVGESTIITIFVDNKGFIQR